MAFQLQPSGVSSSTSKSLGTVLKLLYVHKACSDLGKGTALPLTKNHCLNVIAQG